MDALAIEGRCRRGAGPSGSARGAAALAILVLAAALAVKPPPAQGAPIEPPAPGPPMSALRVSEPIRVDGVLDEAAWQRPGTAPLVQNDPENGRPPRFRTDWWLAYDDRAVYFAGRFYDAVPESIACGLGRRDNFPASDWVVLNLDTFNDDRNGFEFGLTPAGSVFDATIFGDGDEDDSWDGVWVCKARVDSLGWTAEMRIPFSQLKFPNRVEQVWGINVIRHILRFQERDELFHRPRGQSGYVSRFPDLTGIVGIRPARRLDLLTYGVGKGDFQRREKGDPFRSPSELRGDAGTDLRWGLTNDLTLNATINPDFGQVEVDPAVVSLSGFETFYDERRPFFIEDANSFRFASEGTNSNWNFNWNDPLLLYSRRIGRAPQVPLADNDFSDAPGTTTILGAAKAVGTAGRTNYGVLAALTDRENARLAADSVRSEQIAEPRAAYAAARVLSSRSDGGRGLGLMATGVERDLADEASRNGLPRRSMVLGVDGWTRLDRKGVWAVRGYVAGSDLRGTASALDIVQRSSKHYFQRQDADHLHYNPQRTSLRGWMGRTVLNKQSGRTTLNAAAGIVSPGFDANDAGYSFRSDLINVSMVPGYRWLEPGRVFRSLSLNVGAYGSWDSGGNPDNCGAGPFWSGTFSNYAWTSGHLFHNPAREIQWGTRGGPKMRAPSDSEIEFDLGSDDRKLVFASLSIFADRTGDGGGSAHGTLDVTFRPKPSVSVTGSPAYSWSLDHSGWVGTQDDPLMTATHGVRYIFSDLTYREASLATRVDWTFTPALTLQAYVQPLIGVGRYRGLKELERTGSYAFNRYGKDGGSTIVLVDGEYEVDPDGSGPAEPFTIDDPDFSYKSLKVNVVLRWEYQPGSTFYLVWSQNRLDQRDPGDFRLGRDAGSLFDTVGANTLQVKLTKWWGV